MLAYLQPPYVGFVDTDTDDFNAIVADAQHRGLVRTSTEALADLEARLSATVARRLQSEFSDPQAAGAILANSTLEGTPLSARLTLAFLDLAKGDADRLSSWCRHVQIDFRDVYYSAWHQQTSRA